MSHDSPYPSSSDRHVSWTELVYHLDLVRKEIEAVTADVRDLVGVIRSDREQRMADTRWRVALIVTTVVALSTAVVSLWTG